MVKWIKTQKSFVKVAFVCLAVVLLSSLLCIPYFRAMLLSFAEAVLGRSLRNADLWDRRLLFLHRCILIMAVLLPLGFLNLAKYGIWDFSDADSESDKTPSFYLFLKENKFLLAVMTLPLLFMYAARLFTGGIGIDTELYLSGSKYLNWLSLGRFSLIAMQKVLMPFGLNVYLSDALAVFFLYLSAFSWLYLICSFRRLSLACKVIFLCVYTSCSVFCAHIYFTVQSAEVMFCVCVIPFVVKKCFASVIAFDVKGMILTCLAAAFFVSVYQSLIVLFACGLLACFALKKTDNAIYRGGGVFVLTYSAFPCVLLRHF